MYLKKLCLISFLGIIVFAPRLLSAKEISFEMLPFYSDTEERRLLLSLLKLGEVAFALESPDGKMKQVVVCGIINAPKKQVHSIITNIREHPNFINSIISTKIKEEGNGFIIYDYELNAPINNIDLTLKMKTDNLETILVDPVDGDIKPGFGKWQWDLVELPQSQTLVIYYAYADISSINFVLRQIIKIEPSLEFGINIASALTGLVAIKRKAEGTLISKEESQKRSKKGHPASVAPVVKEAQLQDLSALEPLLKIGRIAIIQSYDDGAIKQVNVMAKLQVQADTMYNVIANPGDYVSFVEQMEKSDVVSRGENVINTREEMKLPIIGHVKYTASYLLKRPDFIYEKATGGDITNAQWIWHFAKTPNSHSLVAYSFYTDMREMSWFFRVLFSIDPVMEHGANLGSGLAVLNKMYNHALDLDNK